MMFEELFHATHVANLPSILEHGLVPTAGDFTRRYHEHPAARGPVVPLVYAAGRIIDCPVISALAWRVEMGTGKWRRPPDWVGGDRTLRLYHLPITDDDIVEHGAIVVVPATPFRHYTGGEAPPVGVENGDWYAAEQVPVLRVVAGEELLAAMYDADPQDIRAATGAWKPTWRCAGDKWEMDAPFSLATPRYARMVRDPALEDEIARIEAHYAAAAHAGAPAWMGGGGPGRRP